MEITVLQSIVLDIKKDADVGLCRRKVVALAREIGFTQIQSGEIAILVTELATNVLKHGGGDGRLLASEIIDQRQRKGIEIWVCDKGEGIPDLDKAMKDGYTDKISLGIGLGSINRLSDLFELNPKASHEQTQTYCHIEDYSTRLRVLKWLPAPQWLGKNATLLIGTATRCHPHEILNGDTYLINHLSNNRTLLAVIDGLGHGADAHMASQLAKEKLIKAGDKPIDTLFKEVHYALKGTRGAVMAITIIDTKDHQLFFSGIGNIDCCLLKNAERTSLLSYGGIMGHNMRTPRIFKAPFLPGHTLFMASDGIITRWSPEDIDWQNLPQEIANHFLNTYSRENDDATVLIVQYAS